MSLVYLGINGIGVNKKLLADIVVNEFNILSDKGRARARTPQRTDPTFNVLEYKVQTESQLLRVALDVLGLSKDEKMVKFLIKMSGAKDPEVRRIIARVLGNYVDDDAIERLIKMLLDKDGWVRVNAYMALLRSTGKEYRADWYFGKSNDIKKSYRKLEALIK